jgi:RNA polymerase sigma factor (sigma-70 family)
VKYRSMREHEMNVADHHDETECRNLIAQAKLGQPDPLLELLRRHQEVIAVGIAKCHTLEKDVQADLEQEVRLRVFQRWPNFRGAERVSFKAWLYEIAHGACADEFRRRSKWQAKWDDLKTLAGTFFRDALSQVIKNETEDALHKAIQSLAEEEKRAISLSLCDLSARESAQIREVFKVTPRCVKNLRQVGMPDELVQLLERLEQRFFKEMQFWESVQRQLGAPAAHYKLFVLLYGADEDWMNTKVFNAKMRIRNQLKERGILQERS